MRPKIELAENKKKSITQDDKATFLLIRFMHKFASGHPAIVSMIIQNIYLWTAKISGNVAQILTKDRHSI